MKKVFMLLSALALVLSMSVTALAVTPPLQAPDMPEIPDISDDVKVNISDEYWDRYFDEHPIIPEQTEPPTEPPVNDEPTVPCWHGLISKWYQWLTDNFWRR